MDNRITDLTEDDVFEILLNPESDITILAEYCVRHTPENVKTIFDLAFAELAIRRDFRRIVDIGEVYCRTRAAITQEFRDIFVDALYRAAGSKERILLEASGIMSLDDICYGVKRLKKLMELKEEIFVYDYVRGTGKVIRIDYLNKMVIVDFPAKKSQPLSFEYVLEKITVLPADHIFVRMITNSNELRYFKHEKPELLVEAIKEIIGSSAPEKIKEAMINGRFITQDEWKILWEKVKSQFVEKMDSKSLADNEKDTMKSPQQLLKFLKEKIDRGAGKKELECLVRGIVADFKKYRDPAVLGRTVIMAEKSSMECIVELFLNDEECLYEIFRSIVNSAHGNIVSEFLDMWERRKGKLEFKKVIPFLEIYGLNRMMNYATLKGRSKEFLDELLELRRAGNLNPQHLLWLFESYEFVEEYAPSEIDNIVIDIVRLLRDASRFKKVPWKKKLISLIEDERFMENILIKLKRQTVDTLMEFLRLSGNMDIAVIFLAQIYRCYPETGKHLGVEDSMSVVSMRTTSWRSYRQRYNRLKEIIEKELPKISQEIEVARSYGDLRENYEYKAAKEKQGLLLMEKEQLEKELKEITPTDYSDVKVTDIVLPGTKVVLRSSDNKIVSWVILGEWDSDPCRAIISYTSRIGRNLIGKKIGERIMVDEMCEEYTIINIEALPGDVCAWIKENH